MFYKELTFHIVPHVEDIADALIAALGDFGYDSFSYTDDGFRAYIPSDRFRQKDIDTLDALAFLRDSYDISWEQADIENRDWNKLWEESFSPIVVKGRVLVRASFHPSVPDIEHEIVIDPKMSFGTGHHATTALMLETILDLEPSLRGKRVLDMGCGTGILSIMASQAGAASVTGIDIDEWAYANAQENMAANDIHNINVLIGDASLLDGGETYDIILANINRNILLNDMPRYAAVLRPGGRLVMSGFYTRDVPVLLEKASSLGLAIESRKEQDDWTAIVLAPAPR